MQPKTLLILALASLGNLGLAALLWLLSSREDLHLSLVKRFGVPDGVGYVHDRKKMRSGAVVAALCGAGLLIAAVVGLFMRA